MAERIHRPTLLALAILAYASANVAHEIVGHCGAALLLGGRCVLISTSDIRLAPGVPLDRFALLAAAGTGVNFVLGASALLLLRSRQWQAEPRFLLWLVAALNLLLGAGYMAVSPLIGFGDWHNLLVVGQAGTGWRIAIAGIGAALWLWSWRACRRTLQALLDGDPHPRSAARALLWTSYAAGSALMAAAALLGPLPWRWALFVGLGSSAGLTAPLLALPLAIRPGAPDALHPFTLARRPLWLAAGAIVMLAVLDALGPGFSV